MTSSAPREGKGSTREVAPVQGLVFIADDKVSPAYFSVKGAARYCSLSKSQMDKLLRQKRILAKKCGTRTLIAKTAIDEYVAGLPDRPAMPDYAKDEVRR